MRQKPSLMASTRQLSKTYKLFAAAIIIAIVGGATFFTGLHTPFMGDDNSQIVINTPVHSLTNVKLFFEGGTFYSGEPKAPLSGAYYRPLMTTVFSLLYSLFGPHPYYFHFFQLALYIGSAILLYLVFGYFFRRLLALLLSLIFLVHPLNSQVVYAIPSMQDALFLFFGLSATYILLRFSSKRSLGTVISLLFLALLAKETTVLFIVMGAVYLFWKDRRRLYWFLGGMVLPLIAYMLLRVNAIGLFPNPANAPIASLSLAGRLLTAPSVLWLYIAKFVFPGQLASAYYWTYPHFSFAHVLLPLFLDLVVIAGVVGLAVLIRRKAPGEPFHTFLFFALWVTLGLGMLMQLLPLDMTASEIWFYFPMVGILGMIGVAVTTLSPAWRRLVNYRTAMVLGILIVVVLGVRTGVRGTDWRSEYTLARHDVAASPQDYVADNKMAIYYYGQAKYHEAQVYALRSYAVYPTGSNSNVLGTTMLALGDFTGAARVYNNGLKYPSDIALYDSLASLTSIIHVYGSPEADKQFLVRSLKTYPEDANLWFYLTVLDYHQGDVAGATSASKLAYHLAPTNADITVNYFRLETGKSPYYTFNRDPVPY